MIRTRRFSIKNSPDTPFDLKKAPLFNFNMSPKISFNFEKDTILINWTVTTTVVQTKEELMSILTDFEFEVKDLKTHVKPDNSINAQFLRILTGISISTMRGIILEKVSNSILAKEAMPIIDPAVFFKDENKDIKAPKKIVKRKRIKKSSV